MRMVSGRKFIGAAAAAFLAVCGGAVRAADAPSPALWSDLRWRQIGPFRGGWATVVEGVPGKPDRFYFGAAGGGVWRTDDSGRTWQALFEHGPAASIGALAIAPSNTDVIYIGTGQPETRYDIAAGLGVFKSIDGGAHWTSLGLQNTRHIGRIWVDPENSNIVLVGAQGHFFGPSPDRGVYRSTDGGKTWSHVLALDPWTGVVDIASDPKYPKIIFAAAWEAHQYPWLSYFMPDAGPGSAIYKSADGGLTWHKLSGGGWPTSALGRIGLAVTHTAKATRVYASIDLQIFGRPVSFGRWRLALAEGERRRGCIEFVFQPACRRAERPRRRLHCRSVDPPLRARRKNLRDIQRRSGRRRLSSSLDQSASSRSHDHRLGPGRGGDRERRGNLEQLVQ